MDSVRESGAGVVPLQALEEVFDQQRRLYGGRAPRRSSPGAPAFALELLNTDVDISELATALESEGARRGATSLFSGPPGTGKTALARHLADSLGLRLLEMNASDLLSMWVGGTEAAIRDAFAEAESDGAVLLVDEVDSFLQSRAAAHRAWEVTQVNEMLVQIEGFTVLICCTNRLESVDPAALRRFAWKVRFSPLRADQRVAAVTHCFPGISLTPKEEDAIRALAGVTLGDVAAVRRRVASGKTSHSHALLRLLQQETSYRVPTRPVGFAPSGRAAGAT
jgi:SpoVK/Ycf46/Vps4 family AAA+-type ATPase